MLNTWQKPPHHRPSSSAAASLNQKNSDNIKSQLQEGYRSIDDIRKELKMITKTFGKFPNVRGGAISQLTWSRLFAGKSSDRAAVHGLKKPATHTLEDRERIEEEIEKTKEEQGKRRKEVEEKVDSQLKNSENVVSDSPESLSSS